MKDSAFKTAVLGLTRAIAAEFGPGGLRVNAIAPRFIYSEMTVKALESDPHRNFPVDGGNAIGF